MQYEFEVESLQFNQLAQLSMHPQGTPGGSNSSGSAASLTFLPSAPFVHQFNKLACHATYKSCMLAVGLANLECKIYQHLPASPIGPVSPILCGDLTQQLEKAECSRQFEDCMANSGDGNGGDDNVLPIFRL